MTVEISIPFRANSDGTLAIESRHERQVRQHVFSLINTEPGERTVVTDYGIPLSAMLFEDGDETMVSDLGDVIQDAFTRWEPGLSLRDVSLPDGFENDGLARVEVQYLRTDAPETPVVGRSMNVAVIKNGGQVHEAVRS